MLPDTTGLSFSKVIGLYSGSSFYFHFIKSLGAERIDFAPPFSRVCGGCQEDE